MQRVILVIDDNEELRSHIANALESVGYKAIVAQSSWEGVSMAVAEPPDLVLCDLILPDSVGFDTARALNDHPATSDVPVILMTGYPYMRPHGANSQWRVLSKPFAMQTMLEMVDRVLRSSSVATPPGKN